MDLSESVDRKFIESFDVDDWEVLSDTGYVSIIKSNKTIHYDVYRMTLSDGNELLCADDHIIFNSEYEQVFVKDSLGQSIITEHGTRTVVDVEQLGYSENMYDLSVGENNRYYTNGILSHNSTVITVIVLHFIIFNNSKQVGVLAQKLDQAMDLMGRIQLGYEHLPAFLKPGIKEWNKKSFTLDNGSWVIAGASGSSSVRGKSLSLLVLDEHSHLPRYAEFAASVLPTLSSGKESRLICASTPFGLNQWYDLVIGAREGTNGFWLKEVPWNDVPGRDEDWKQKTLEDLNFDMLQFAVEYDLEFQGSSGTLLSGSCLKGLKASIPLSSKDGLTIYAEKAPKRVYTMICDVSHGKGLDYSTVSVIDVSELPYKQVATYRNNTIAPKDFAEIINSLGRYYNDSTVLVENNDIGSQVTYILWNEFEYPNLVSSQGAGRLGKKLVIGVGTKSDFGIRMTSSVKSLGCSVLKLLMEQGQLIIIDKETIGEFNRFSKKGSSYAAEENCHDDCVMPLVSFAWMTTTELFKEISGQYAVGETSDYLENQLANNLLSMGMKIDGTEEQIKYEKFDGDSDWWVRADYDSVSNFG